MCMDVLFTCISVYHLCTNVCRGQKRALRTLELEIQIIVSHHRGAENQTWVPWKSHK